MKIKKILNIILLIFIFIFQFSFLSALPGSIKNINLLLVLLIYFLTLFESSSVILISLFWGLLLDSFSVLPYGFNMISFFIVIVATNYLLNRFFTNRSLVAFLALVFFATIFNFIIIGLLSFVYDIIFTSGELIFDASYFRSAASEIILNISVMLILFYLTNFISQKFKPVFLNSK